MMAGFIWLFFHLS
jgi:hypothetical protein